MEQKTTVVGFQTCYTSSTEGTIRGSIWKNQQPTTVFLHDAKNPSLHTTNKHIAYLCKWWQNGTRCRDGVKVLWCHWFPSSLVGFLGFHPYMACFPSENFLWLVGQRWDTTHATEAPPTIDLPSSRKCWCSPMVLQLVMWTLHCGYVKIKSQPKIIS